MDTQLLRNAYLERPVEELATPFGKWVANYLGVKDKAIMYMGAHEACNYILLMGYNVEKAPDPSNNPKQEG